MAQEYNQTTERYEEGPKIGSRGLNKDHSNYTPNSLPVKTPLVNNSLDPTRHSDYLRDILDQQRNGGYRGGSGYNYKPITFGGFSDEYNKYRTDQTGRVEAYMDNPRGYDDQEFGMMQGRAQDAITAQGGGYRQMMEDALSKGGMSSGSLYSGLNTSGRNTQNASAGMQRDLALQDMDIRRQQQQVALGMGNQWAGQMSSDSRWLTEGQMGVDAQNEAGRRAAASSASSGRNAYNNRLLQLQLEIGAMDVDQKKYQTEQDWRTMLLNQQNPSTNKPTLYANPYK